MGSVLINAIGEFMCIKFWPFHIRECSKWCLLLAFAYKLHGCLCLIYYFNVIFYPVDFFIENNQNDILVENRLYQPFCFFSL